VVRPAIAAVLVLLAAALAPGPAAASAQRYGAIKTPSGNIVCGFG
jgi:hypothetical protein